MEAETMFVWTRPKPELCYVKNPGWPCCLSSKVNSTTIVQFDNACIIIHFNTEVMWYPNETFNRICSGMMAQ